MPRDYRWRDLVVGLASLAAVVVAALSVLLFARIGALRGDTYTLYMPAGEARGVIRGTDVWLAGQRVGVVNRIDFAPPTLDVGRRLMLELDMLEKYREFVRRDSYAQIRSGGSLIGAPVVYITVGTLEAPVIPNGGVIASHGQVDAETFASEMALGTRELPAIIANVRTINAQFKGMRAVMSGLTGDRGGIEIDVVSIGASRLTRRATTGDGTIPLFLRDERLLDRASRSMARADSLMRVLSADNTTAAHVRRDSTLMRSLANTRNELSILRTRLTEARGSAGRFRADSAIVREVSRLEQQLTRTIEDFKRDPGRYIAF